MLLEPLSPDALCRRCDPEQFTFTTTAELEDLTEVIGQARAVAAVRFAVGIRQPGYNLFALGPNGLGKHTAVSQYLHQKAATTSPAADWCYVYDFGSPHQPRALRLPPGRGTALQGDVKQLVEDVCLAIPAAFEREEYRLRKEAIEEELKQRQEKTFDEVRQAAEKRGIAVLQTQTGVAFAPIQDGAMLEPEQFQKLPLEEQRKLETVVGEVQEELERLSYQFPQWQRVTRARLKELNEEVARHTITPLLDEVSEKYQELPEVQVYLAAMKQDMVENVERFLDQAGAAEDSEEVTADDDGSGHVMALGPGPFQRRYQVNLLVDNGRAEGAPVVYEDNPTYENLVGRIEHIAQMGALMTDFTLIKAGALHRANGGYLILDAHKVLLQSFAWEGLKRALRAREIRTESLSQLTSMVSTVSLTPEPIPLDVKVVLLGERPLYYLLYEEDPDFSELFKVTADFEDEMERTAESNLAYARLITTIARKDSLRHFERAAVARVIERSARLAGDTEKLTTHMQAIADMLREADYWAAEAGREVVTAADVQQAIDAHAQRAGRLRDQSQEEILRRMILIDTQGERVGQINGLSVISVGDFAFGQPTRITARVRLGKGEVVDIERQVELGGPIHSKGVLILTSFLGARYAPDRPLSLAASLVFEQSYSGVEGDSASSAELYALLSALADVPIRQSLAVTGSVNQFGEVQAIGGVNEKIEGFFDICRARGLTGEQGVIIPVANIKHLMLREDVVEAAGQGLFHIYAVETVDEGLEILTGLEAGRPDVDGRFPIGSLNQRVEARLKEFAEHQRAFKVEG
ncbi:MAG: ATP-binding protein [Chloroflexota bacterium]